MAFTDDFLHSSSSGVFSALRFPKVTLHCIYQRLICLKMWRLESKSGEMRLIRLRRRKMFMITLMSKNNQILFSETLTYLFMLWMMTYLFFLPIYLDSMMVSRRKCFPNMMTRLQTRCTMICYASFCSSTYISALLMCCFSLQGVTLDSSGRFTGEAERKLEEVLICC